LESRVVEGVKVLERTKNEDGGKIFGLLREQAMKME